MTDPRPSSAGDARAALDAVSRAELAGLRAAVPPRWFVAMCALLAGLLVAVQQAWLTVVLLLLVLQIGKMRKRDAPATRRRAKMSDHPWWSAVGILIAIGLMVLVYRVNALADRGAVWAPVILGAACGLALVGLHEWGRARLRAMERRGAS